MIQRPRIFPLASTGLSWHLNETPLQDTRAWLANSPLGQSGDISDTSLRTKGLVARIPCCTAARAVRAMPNTPSETTGCGARFLRSGNGFAIAKTPPLLCAPIARSTPIGQRSRPHPHAGAASAKTSAAKVVRGAASTTPATARTLHGAASAYLRFARRVQEARSKTLRLTPLPHLAALTAAAASTTQPRRATVVADAIAARPADSRQASYADSGQASRVRMRARHRPHPIVTHTSVAHPQSSFPYTCNTSPA